jgi:hypothetical protein
LGAATREARPNGPNGHPLNGSDLFIIKISNVAKNNGGAVFLWQLG